LSSVIASGAQRVVVLGDALHCPAQLTEPEWHFVYVVDPQAAAATRAQLIRLADDPNTSLLPCHFPGMVAARLIAAEGNAQWLF
jgi:glyoxylase-like metal-dependent hydrolase (beta-lactamase superfamily II)